jgi:putative membrane protein
MKKIFNVLTISLFIVAISSCTKEPLVDRDQTVSNVSESEEDELARHSHSSLKKEDKVFLIKSAQGAKMEIALGNLAQTHASSYDVKAFGSKMVTDHTAEYHTVKSLANSKGLSVPDEPSKKQQKIIDKLSCLYGSNFDKAYMSFMVEDHHEDIDLTQHEIDHGEDQDVIDFANSFLPILYDHLGYATQVATWIGAI